MNVATLLEKQVIERGDAPAISERRGWLRRRDCTVTFVQLDRLAEAAAAVLTKAGLRAGDRAIVLCPMSIDLYAAMLAMFRIGVVPTFLDPGLGVPHVEACCAIAQPRAFAGSPKAHLLRLRSRGLRSIAHRFVIGGYFPGATRLALASTAGGGIIDRTADDPALLTFTSGSTGTPKAALRTHGFLEAQLRVLREAIDLHPGEVDLTTLPIFLLANLASGVHSVIADADLRRPGSISAARVLRQIDAMKPTRSIASPAFFLRVIERCEIGHRLDSFKRIDTGGAPVFPRLLHRLKQSAPNARIVALYGSTEAEPIAHVPYSAITTDDHATISRGGGLLAGEPIRAIRLRIIHHASHANHSRGSLTATAFEDMCMTPGNPGEVVVTGDHVLKGYLNGVGDDETKLRVDGTTWHRTGDAGYLDARGRLWLLGRAEARIEDERGELYPFAVECAAMASPLVRRAALIGYEGKRILVVERADGKRRPLDELREQLAWAHLDDVLVVDAIPVDARHNAKADYPALRRLVAARLAHQERT